MDKLLDVTLREVSLATDYRITVDEGLDLLTGLARTAIDIAEIGYFRPRLWDRVRSWESCPPEVLGKARAALGDTQLSVFVHLGTVTAAELAVLRDEGVDLVRVGIGPLTEADRMRALAEDLHRCGLPFSINVIRASQRTLEDATALGRLATETGARVLYFADSNGALYTARVAELIRAMQAGTDVPLGLHAHDNLSLAFANALIALEHGVSWLDSCLGGAGKGGGNLSTERIALYLHSAGIRRFGLTTIDDLSRSWLVPRQLDPPGFWEAVNGTLDLDMEDCLRAGALHPDERAPHYQSTYGLTLTT
ncbi:MAG: 4-hydroxy 2-oxovalerate aldolase, partial [Pseudonocardiales bacterium]|nr:4-hydroxy 2-oxovalerate aldolase [Pseudonocardiales bacterium]